MRCLPRCNCGAYAVAAVESDVPADLINAANQSPVAKLSLHCPAEHG